MHYRVVGQDDYMLIIQVEPDGVFTIDQGDYTSHKPSRGQVDKEHQQRLRRALDALGEARDHPAPDGASGFIAELTIGDGADARRYRFWEGALAQQADLNALVRELEVLG
ncbi:hypothetical protein F2Q65_00025 [Thiohalocapsa marina]|uniref:Uncharacterized protein n=1 Tax=Thiohalocapsa marina TaxID=424902 RepID=A0A5M8FVT2_9GAMM|nr:hypothetical protein F2Q65_00025 [Thiohalocapsa marina]